MLASCPSCADTQVCPTNHCSHLSPARQPSQPTSERVPCVLMQGQLCFSDLRGAIGRKIRWAVSSHTMVKQHVKRNANMLTRPAPPVAKLRWPGAPARSVFALNKHFRSLAPPRHDPRSGNPLLPEMLLSRVFCEIRKQHETGSTRYRIGGTAAGGRPWKNPCSSMVW